MEQIGHFYFSVNRTHDCYLSPSHREILKYLIDSYNTDDAIERLILQTTPDREVISLRLLDWFVTNYSKKKQTSWVIRDGHGDHIIVQAHQQYMIELGNWKRVLFDPFQRRGRLKFKNKNGDWHTTTVAQMNFLKFANYTGIYDYVSAHRIDIESDMNRISRKRNKNLTRTSLSTPPNTVFFVSHVTQMTT